jgi:hypothetical protein
VCVCVCVCVCALGHITHTLTRTGGSNRTWKKRWVVLTNSCVYYFKKKASMASLGESLVESEE